MENECKYVSSRGFLKSCDIHMPNPQSSSSTLDLELYKQIQRGSTVYVCNSALRFFRESVLPSISVPFILVSGDSDVAMPYDAFSESEFQSFINDSRVSHWFCQNLMISHPKMTHLPIGLDYHTLSKVGEQHPWGTGKRPLDQEQDLVLAIQESPPMNERHLYCYSNFHHATFAIGSRGDRKEVVEKVPKDIVFYDPVFTSRDIAWNHQSFFSFVLSPRGGGYDCHRTWEALLLGCIPVLKSSGLDPLFDGLPVLLVKEWSDLTKDRLIQYMIQYSTKNYQKEKLLLSYWIDLFRQKAKLCL
jgi:hypothetical protein